MRLIAFLIALIPLPAIAQSQFTQSQMVASDLNGDGRVERFSLAQRDGGADLIIENTGGGVVVATDLVWSGGIGQKPELGLAPNGSVRVISQNMSIGRNRWVQTLTIAHRKGGYMIVGFTYEWFDTLNPKDAGTCDLNLLNGKGEMLNTNGQKRRIRHPHRAMPVTRMNTDYQGFGTCFPQ